MLNVKSFAVNMLEVNCYVISDETNEAVIIDPGCFTESEWAQILTYIKKEKLSVKHVLLTHAHFDHVMGCHLAKKDLGLAPEGNAADLDTYQHLSDWIERTFQTRFDIPEQPSYSQFLSHGDKVLFGSHELSVLHTPGHSQGCICFYCQDEGLLFSGDTLFQGSVGRTDFPGGSTEQIIQSIRNNLLTLPDTTKVYPGHGPSTTIAFEKKYNPYF